MAVTTTHAYKVYNGNGVATSFPIDFQFLLSAELVVTLISSAGVEAVKTISTHYTVSGGADASGNPATGTVTMLTAPATGEKLRIDRATALSQSVSHTNNDAFPAKTVEKAYDWRALVEQDTRLMALRSLKLSMQDYVAGVSAVLPSPEAGKLIGWNGDADELTNYSAADLDLALVSDWALGLLDDADAGEGLETLGLKFATSIHNGADDTGSVSAVNPLTNLFAETVRSLFITNGSYTLGADVTPAASDVDIKIDPGATFAGAGLLKFDSLIPYQVQPVWSQDLVRKTFGADFASYDAIFMRAGYAKVTHANPNTVAMFGAGESAVSGGNAWGGNFVGTVSVAGGSAIACELNPEIVDGATGEAYGLVIASAGEQPIRNAIQIQSNDALCEFIDGIRFNWRDAENLLTGAVFHVGTSGITGACERLLYSQGMDYSLAEIEIPSFSVDATPASLASRLRIAGGTTLGPLLSVIGAGGTPATNADMRLTPLGTGVYRFLTNDGTEEAFRVHRVANAVNFLRAAGAAAGSSPILSAQGAGTDLDMALVPKGTGVVSFGTHSAVGAETITGFITIKDAAGNSRKIAVIS